MLPDTKDGQNCGYALCYWHIYYSLGGKAVFPKSKAEQAAKQALIYLAHHLSAEEALQYTRSFNLDKSDYWKTL